MQPFPKQSNWFKIQSWVVIHTLNNYGVERSSQNFIVAVLEEKSNLPLVRKVHFLGGEERCIGEYSGVTRTLHMER